MMLMIVLGLLAIASLGITYGLAVRAGRDSVTAGLFDDETVLSELTAVAGLCATCVFIGAMILVGF